MLKRNTKRINNAENYNIQYIYMKLKVANINWYVYSSKVISVASGRSTLRLSLSLSVGNLRLAKSVTTQENKYQPDIINTTINNIYIYIINYL